MILFHSLHVTPKQDYLHSIHFHSFPFLYFKTSNQCYLIPFHSILFHSFPLLKYISFHSIHFHSLMIIQFNSLMNSQTEPKYKYMARYQKRTRRKKNTMLDLTNLFYSRDLIIYFLRKFSHSA